MLVYSDSYNTDLAEYGIDKPFAVDRGALVLEQLRRDRSIVIEVFEPEPLLDEDILRVHSAQYLDSLRDDANWLAILELNEREYDAKRAKRPLHTLIDDFRLKCGGTKRTCRLALDHGLAANLGGGFHHAFPDQGRGFCPLNDIAIAVRAMQNERLVNNVLVVDLDFHQGDGTALIFQDDPTVFTFSVHSREGWPETKQNSDLDVAIAELDAGRYLELAKAGLFNCLEKFDPELGVYVAGSDPYEKDVLPGTKFINLSLETMEERDRFVIDTFCDRRMPLAMLFAGGYGPHVWQVHYRAVRHLIEKRAELNQASAARSST